MAASTGRVRNGVLLGLAAALIWGGYLAYSRLGVTQGLKPVDFAFLRFSVAGLVTLPFLLRHGAATMAGVGWRRAFILTLCAGPLFMLIVSGAYQFAPLPHGAVVPPSAMTVMSMVLAARVLGDRPSALRVAGVGIILIGLVCVAGGGFVDGRFPQSWIGDLLFATAGSLWAVFTVLQKRWGIAPMQATAALSVMSLVLLLPPFLVFAGFERLLALPPATLATQVVVQGLLAGVVAVVAFAAAVVILGASRAALFPALVPGTAILVGIPLTGEWPSPLQWIGIVVVMLGLGAAMGVGLPRRR
ncbi:MAG: DMT family transporter [Rhodospirillaceae bacterium]|nr:DMT family transporter [Rhodospirillaceae bacterium]